MRKPPDLDECIGAESTADYRRQPPPLAPPPGRRQVTAAPPAREVDMPVVPIVARDERTPRAMARFTTEDGRLLIREEPVRNNGYMRVVRTDGRLVVYIVPLDDDGDGDRQPE
ncbi:hypothetical protein M569_15149 [Genlisea aurea]|uniref:FAF domain-containing protein n=1 Tax=Genlisea aurea TaxID=192259 RepID=S8C5D6_9LAMI|nr:hypothetical protein M569_15149 [Genlisea aurea]